MNRATTPDEAYTCARWSANDQASDHREKCPRAKRLGRVQRDREAFEVYVSLGAEDAENAALI